jgi:regulator of sigma E protease
MVDETKSADSLGEEPQPWEFRSKPTWQRFFIIVGGVLFNFISAILLYVTIFYTWGETYIPIENAKYGYKFTEVAQNIGFQDGDKILSVDSIKPLDLSDFATQLVINNVKNVNVLRGDSVVSIAIPNSFGRNVVGEGKGMFCTYQFPFVVSELMDNFPAQAAGLQVGDSVIALNGVPTLSYYSYQESFKNSPDKPIQLTAVRGDSIVNLTLTPNIDGIVGLYPTDPQKYIETKTNYFNFWQSIPKGLNHGVETLGMYIKQFKLVFTKEGASQIGGFGSIGKLFSKTWDWGRFWSNTALLAIILAFMNILPIPALDGGYILFILIEMITGKKPSDKFLGYANTVGFALLIALLLYANGMDIFRGLFK